jgi:hypothetical protein
MPKVLFPMRNERFVRVEFAEALGDVYALVSIAVVRTNDLILLRVCDSRQRQRK